MRRRLVLSYLVLATVVLLVLEIPLGVQSARRDRDQLAGQAQRDAQALAVLAGEDLEHPTGHDLGRLVSQYRAQATGSEVAIVDAHGNYVVRLDPERERDADDAVLGPGIARALTGKPVTASHRDEGRPVLTATVPIGVDVPSLGAVVFSTPADTTDDQIEMTWAELAVGGILILGVTTLVGLRLARSVTAPLARLEGAVSRLGHGELSIRATPGGPEEIRALGEEFNQMAVRLEELVNAQARFVADASHQLRSPLTALRLRLENLAADGGGREAVDLAAAESEVMRLSRLVDGLLTLNRAENDSQERAEVDVAALVDERCEAWSPLAVERQLSLVVDHGDVHTLAHLVPGDLEQVVDNLLANAFDATPSGRSITLRVDTDSASVAVHVSDEGPGMSEEDRVHAFDRFWQGSERRTGRSGLGLAIVRQLVVHNGGSVELRCGDRGGLEAVVTFKSGAVPTSPNKTRHRSKRR